MQEHITKHIIVVINRLVVCMYEDSHLSIIHSKIKRKYMIYDIFLKLKKQQHKFVDFMICQSAQKCTITESVDIHLTEYNSVITYLKYFW